MDTYNYFNAQLALGNMERHVIDKRQSARNFLEYNLMRLSKLFKVSGLPDTIPKEFYDRFLFLNGTCFLTKVKGDLYIFQGSFGGEPDAYYRPTLYIVANPALKYNATLDIQKDGVLLRNDPLWLGLYPMLSRYSVLMAENILTMRMADIMLRTPAYLSAPDDKTQQSAIEFLHQLEDGKLGVIGENRFFEGLKLQSPPSSNGSYLTQFIELQQYYIGSFYAEIGLEASFNMKREALSDSETQMNNDIMLPLIDEMLQVRKEDFDKVNAMYGTNITIDFDSAWKDNLIQLEAELKLLQSQIEVSQLTSGGIPNDGAGENGTSTDGDGEQSTNDADRTDGTGNTENTRGDATDAIDSNNTDEQGTPNTSDIGDDEVQSNDTEQIAININVTNINNGDGETEPRSNVDVQINNEDVGSDDQSSDSTDGLSTDDNSDEDDK